MGDQLVGSTAAAAAATTTTDNVVSKQEALRRHKEWLVNFRRDMSLLTANVSDQHRSAAAQHPMPTEQSSLTS